MLRRSVLLLVVLLATALHAEHFLASSITARCLGGNMYEVTLELDLACNGQAPVPQTLHFTNDCGLNFFVQGLEPDSMAEVSPLCASELPNSTCNGGALLGVKAYFYRTQLFLATCNAWTIWWEMCCRGSSLTANGTPGLYIEARLDNATVSCNDLPVFSDHHIPYVCDGQPVVYNASAVDLDADSLRYRLVEARFYNGSGPFPINYLPPYFGGQPFTGMTIDASTGSIAFTPTLQGLIITAVQVDEYTTDGTWLGSVVRDFVFVVRACSNTPPPTTAGTIANVSGGGMAIGDRTVRACTNGQVCFTAAFTDPDAAQQLTLTSNVTEVLPGAEFIVVGGAPANVTICWDGAAQTGGAHDFTITATDNACPITASQTYTYTVLIDTVLPYAGTDTTTAVCPQADPFALLDSLAGGPPLGGTWSNASGAHSGIFLPGTDAAGEYVYTITSATNCPGTATLTVEYLPEDLPLCILMSTMEHVALRPLVFPNPAASSFTISGLGTSGAVLIQLIDGVGRMVWTAHERVMDGRAQAELPSSIAPGNYVLRLTDPAGGQVRHAPLSVE